MTELKNKHTNTTSTTRISFVIGTAPQENEINYSSMNTNYKLVVVDAVTTKMLVH